MELSDFHKGIIGSILRWLLGGLTVWLLNKGVLTEEQSAWFTSEYVIGGIISGGISLYLIYRKNKQVDTKIETLREMPAGVTDAELKAVIEHKKKRRKPVRRAANPYRPADAPPLPRIARRSADDDDTPTQPLGGK